MMPPAEDPASSAAVGGDDDVVSLLPLGLVRAQLIAPAPNRGESALDWLPEFGGPRGWRTAPPPSSSSPTSLPLSPTRSPTSALSSTRPSSSLRRPPPSSTPSPGAPRSPPRARSPPRSAASSACIRPSPAPTDPAVVIEETFRVEAVAWTGSGDGLIAAGSDVVLWVRKQKSWGLGWRSKARVPQSLVSATWFAEGPVATAARSAVRRAGADADEELCLPGEECGQVLVYLSDDKSGLTEVHLCHPQAVSMIQWRPSARAESEAGVSHVWRDVLLTCCVDGTVRLWSENDNGRPRKLGRAAHSPKAMRKSFHVVAAIEINNILKGILGADTFVKWAIEFDGVISKDEGGRCTLSSARLERHPVGKCEWLISVGPGFSVTFWAVHCLDDVSPARFPRVTLWRKQNITYDKENKVNHDFRNSGDQPILMKVITYRRVLSGPPVACSLLQLLPGSLFGWSMIYGPKVDSTDGVSTKSVNERVLSCYKRGFLCKDGHASNIMQVSVHPYGSEIELAVSLDSSGGLLFWSLSTFSTSTSNSLMLLHPPWSFLGKVDLREFSPNIGYSCLSWAPSILDEKRFLLLGSENGIDCFIVRIPGKGANISCCKIFTILYDDGNFGKGPPNRIYVTPLASNCGATFFPCSFVLFCIWRKKFQASSWKVILHSETPSGNNCECGFDAMPISVSEKWRYVSSFEGKTYYATIFPGSSCGLSPSYHMATGCFDGTLKLWKMSGAQSVSHSDRQVLHWELMGMFTAHQGPVSGVALSSCGRKIATVSSSGQANITNLHIWEPVCLVGGGGFLLEDAITLQTTVLGLSWSSLGNGQLLLGVCMPNELRVYFRKRPSDQNSVHPVESEETHLWFCVAMSHSSSDIKDFLWGPKVTPVLVHEKHLSLFSQWLFRTDIRDSIDDFVAYAAKLHELSSAADSAENTFCDSQSSDNSREWKNSHKYCSLLPSLSHQKSTPDYLKGVYNLLDITDKLGGPLPVYHPKALFQYLYSGNWKRAQVVLKHLVDSLKTHETSNKNLACSRGGKSCHDVPEIDLSEYFMDTASTNFSNEGLQWGQNISTGISGLKFHSDVFHNIESSSGMNVSTTYSEKSEIVSFIDTLQNCCAIAAITDIERTQILAIIELLGEIGDSAHASVYKSLDEAGRRFWVAVRFQHLYMLRNVGNSAQKEMLVDSLSIAWAFQSDCQDDLLNSVLPPEPTWQEMRNLGVGLWYTNIPQLRAKVRIYYFWHVSLHGIFDFFALYFIISKIVLEIEKLARLQYLRNKDPKECALLYLALNRRQVLAGLFKISKNEKDKVLFAFLSRNFEEEKNKAAALKNAYVLMGRHQLELAIAFFILGGDPSSAVTVCAKNLGDEQLALVICRLTEGYGGPLEHSLISNILLPNSVEKGDYWLSSLLEWTLGNFSLSLQRLFDAKPVTDKSCNLCDRAVSSDPGISQYCAIIATKNNFRNSVGDALATRLSKLSTSLTSSALNRCGLSLEALECLSSTSNVDTKDQDNSLYDGDNKIFIEILKCLFGSGPNWLSGDAISYFDLKFKLNMALEYISKLMKGHPQWPRRDLASMGEIANYEENNDLQIEELSSGVKMVVSIFEKKFALKFVDLAEMILVFACNEGLLFLAYLLLQHNRSSKDEADNYGLKDSILTPTLRRLLLKASKDICFLFAGRIVFYSFTDSTLKLIHKESFSFANYCTGGFCLANLICLLRISKSLLNHYDKEIFSKDSALSISAIFDLLEFSVEFAFTWFRKDVKKLIMLIRPILDAVVTGDSSIPVKLDELMKILRQNFCGTSNNGSCQGRLLTHSEDSMPPLDEKWHVVSACLWIHLSTFVKKYLSNFLVTDSLEDDCSMLDVDLINLSPFLVAKFVMNSLDCISSSLTKQFASFLRHKRLKNLPSNILILLDANNCSQPGSLNYYQSQQIGNLDVPDNKDDESLFNLLWEISVKPQDICAGFVNERVDCFPYNNPKLCGFWKVMERGILVEEKSDASLNGSSEDKSNSTAPNNGTGRGLNSRIVVTDGPLDTERKHSSDERAISYFNYPRELIKRNGELLEAICFNSINEQQVAVASNRKGLLFFTWKDDEQHYEEQTDYLWPESDWPPDGWAGGESTPIPTYVSPGIGLGSKRGAHLGLGGATLGLGSLARPGRDLTGGGAFGIPGYAGIGASGLGWGEQEDFEEFIDPPPTVENVHSRALSCHPSQPLLLVGSSNTHVYLWEFGKDTALATYGVLPAANVPPPYALASVSAIQFDFYGHRFASAALDGTVCTWQLEVGGRSNVQPIESSLCFNNHASDVAYVGANGSIVAAAGFSSNGVNLVIWDTLAPPSTCQASVVCHEGGARSISVLDNDIGNGSISPIIVTGGKSGDVGLHDFRFIATGKTKHHKSSREQDLKSTNGMIWYIPKAHLGSITKISTIPNTSLFLTGGKDGDVKLWDAKRCQLVHQWPKLHDRHTFFQPNSRGFGGVVRAAVTDIQVLSHGFLSCGGDGSVKLVQLRNLQHQI
uniref:RAVE complex protein Rav1 C-terminal domain-containing protein n=1 Tax=Ananas comosus var. bracteatus TaxID=296719 RepID=A0A6V7P0G4_ANACO|nr:unnamed protein product [Ananas comosus var. bracteatus]